MCDRGQARRGEGEEEDGHALRMSVGQRRKRSGVRVSSTAEERRKTSGEGVGRGATGCEHGATRHKTCWC